jgi:hypothetical protein
MDVMPAEPLAPVQKAELQQHTHTDDVATGSLHQADCGFDSAPGGEDVIHDQHAISRRKRPVLHLDGRLGVLELVGGPVRHAGQLALLAHRHESGAEVVRNGRGDDEPARLDADDLLNRSASSGLMSLKTTPGFG